MRLKEKIYNIIRNKDFMFEEIYNSIGGSALSNYTYNTYRNKEDIEMDDLEADESQILLADDKSQTGESQANNICEDINLSGWKAFYFTSDSGKLEDKYGRFRMIKKILTGKDNMPNLVVMAGLSTKSFCKSTEKIINNMKSIDDMYNAIYIIKYDEDKCKKLQVTACSKRDENKKTTTNIEEIYEPEVSLNEELGIIVDKMLRCAGIKKIHLLGKCAGGGVAIHTFTKNLDLYEALYLAVPASPLNIHHLLDKNIMGKKFIFAWDKRDHYEFDWGRLSKDEKKHYDKTLKKFDTENNIVITAIFGKGPGDPKEFHEIPDELFPLIRENN